jgi:hypothetical protein
LARGVIWPDMEKLSERGGGTDRSTFYVKHFTEAKINGIFEHSFEI